MAIACTAKDCPKEANYGFKTGPRVYCANHKLEKMCNKKAAVCKYEDCITRANFSSLPSGKKDFCKDHCIQLTGTAVDVGSDKCHSTSCSNQSGWQIPGKPQKFCGNHKTGAMINFRVKKCNVPGCSVESSFGFHGDRKRLTCTDHATDGMVNLKSRICAFENCHKIASFNEIGEKAKFCLAHSEQNMSNVRNKSCAFLGCSTIPVFGLETVTHCINHKSLDMTNLTKKTCEIDGCDVWPSFGFEDGKPIRCSEHKISTMVNVYSKKCDICGITASFGFENGSPTKCSLHKEAGMANLISKKCNEDGCETGSSFGFENGSPTKCSLHKEAGMVNLDSKKCQTDGCDTTASFGYILNKCLTCSAHKMADMVDVRSPRFICDNCGLEWRKRDKTQTVCSYCKEPGVKMKKKENIIRDILIANGYDNFIQDKACNVNGSCRRYRPDFLFDCGTHFVIVEVDEHAHQDYDSDCEIARMVAIHSNLGLDTVFIRYNPDKTGLRKIIKHKKLLEILGEKTKEKPKKSVDTVYLFY